MKKVLFFCSLITIIGFSHITFAESEQVLSENEIVSEVTPFETVSSSPKATSNASIGFSTKSIISGGKGNNGGASPTGRLPTTGESIGIGLSLLGLVLIIVIFRKELKDILKIKKIQGGRK